MVIQQSTRWLLPLVAMLALAACGEDDLYFPPAPPADPLSGHPQALPEGDEGELTTMQMLVTLTEPMAQAVTIQYQTEAFTATAGEDYIETFGELELAPGEIEQRIPVYLLGDDIEEPAEQFVVHLRASGNVALTSDTVLATIANDDTACDQPFVEQPNPWLVNGGDPMSYAHRGGVIDFPENTLYAYKKHLVRL